MHAWNLPETEKNMLLLLRKNNREVASMDLII
jgi:hypothetical protein